MKALIKLISLLFFISSLTTPSDAKTNDHVLTLKAKLLKIEGSFPPNDLYDYAFVMKYQAVGGKFDKQIFYVAHYKPRLARKKIKDKMKKHVGGSLKRFKEGDMHQLVLSEKLKKIWRGAIVDEFFAKDRKSKRYWCLSVDKAKPTS